MLTLLRNARVFAPEPLGTSDILVAGGSIAYLGASLEALPSGLVVDTVDLDGRNVVPAFVDGHAHVTGGGGEAGFGSRVPPPSAQSYRAAGIGSVVGVLGTDDLTRTTGSLLAWTRELRAAGISAWCHTGGYHLPPTTLTGSVRGDIVWLDPVIGVGELAVSDHRSSQPTVQELRRIASDAHVAGLMTGKAGIVHLHVGDGESGLEPVRATLAGTELPRRVLQPTHVNRRRALWDDAVAFAREGGWIDATAFPVDDAEDAWSASAALIRYLESGAPEDRISVSTDAGGCLPTFDEHGRVRRFDVAGSDTLLACLRECVAAGAELSRVLPALTSNPADYLRLPKGHLAVGSDADLLVLSDTLALEAGVYGGVWHNGDGIRCSTAGRALSGSND